MYVNMTLIIGLHRTIVICSPLLMNPLGFSFYYVFHAYLTLRHCGRSYLYHHMADSCRLRHDNSYNNTNRPKQMPRQKAVGQRKSDSSSKHIHVYIDQCKHTNAHTQKQTHTQTFALKKEE